MAMMDAAKMGHSPIPVDRLINMTHSTEECQAIYEAHDDASLGRFYVGNDFPIIPPNLPEAVYEILDYDSIGRKARIGEGGVFTQNGYVVQNGEMACLYHKGDAVPIEKPDYMVLLKVTKGYCDTPYAYIKLPAKSDALSQAVQATGAASAEECVCTAEDCIIPWMSELTTDELGAGYGGCYDTVNELAGQIKKLDQGGGLTTYKAMLEAAPKDIALEEALDLSYQTVSFSVIKEAFSPEGYARFMLSKYSIELSEELFANTDLRCYGEKLMAEKGVSATEYGALLPLTGETLEQCLDRPVQSKGVEMT